jgi:hypothetical protein
MLLEHHQGRLHVKPGIALAKEIFEHITLLEIGRDELPTSNRNG